MPVVIVKMSILKFQIPDNVVLKDKKNDKYYSEENLSAVTTDISSRKIKELFWL